VRYRRFGRTGWQVSQIGAGTWALGWGAQDEGESIRALHKALDLGCNFVDTARQYGDGKSECTVAKTLQQWGGNNRVYLATKIPPIEEGYDWPPGPYDTLEQRYPEKHIRRQLENSLKALGTDCIDLVQIHTWSRAWNRDPRPIHVLQECRKEGKLRAIGISTPEQDQNAVLDILRADLVDAVQLCYNIFEQEPQAELLPTAMEHDVGVIVRVPFDESGLTGKLTPDTKWDDDDIRSKYYYGDRLRRTVARVERIRQAIGASDQIIAGHALAFCLKPKAVSTVIPGIRSVRQAEVNCAAGDAEPMSDEVERRLRTHYWRRSFWYSGK
jgi:aryl-alcohol dehydrogenase-like predicted oxidoreductase